MGQSRAIEALLSTGQTEALPDDRIFLHEKVDGCNARIVLVPDDTNPFVRDFFLGSRDSFLYAKGDRIGDPTMSIVDTLKIAAQRVADLPFNVVGSDGGLVVIFGEVYGNRVGSNWKNYDSGKATGFRVFDVAYVEDWKAMLEQPKDRIASWREHGGQKWVPTDSLVELADNCGLDYVPYIDCLDRPSDIPTRLTETLEWMDLYGPYTEASLDPSVKGKKEGLIARTDDRRVIVKIRYEDYERTIRRTSQGKRTE